MGNQEETKSKTRTLDDLRKFLDDLEEGVRREVDRAVPELQKQFDSSIQGARKSFETGMQSVGSTTNKQQVEVLKGYQRFLAGQARFVESRLKQLESEKTPAQ